MDIGQVKDVRRGQEWKGGNKHTLGKSNSIARQSKMLHVAAFRGADPFLFLTHVLVDYTAQPPIEKVVSHSLMARTHTHVSVTVRARTLPRYLLIPTSRHRRWQTGFGLVSLMDLQQASRAQARSESSAGLIHEHCVSRAPAPKVPVRHRRDD